MEEEIIFKIEKEGTRELSGILGLGLIFLFLAIGILQSQVLTILILLICSALIYQTLQTRFNYAITEKGIDFFQIISNKPMEHFSNSQIQLVRFEDGFKLQGNTGDKDRIFIYPYKKSKIKFPDDGDYIPLLIGEKKEGDIIRILKHFQEQKVEVVIKTRRTKIKQALLPKIENREASPDSKT